jgi:hypothetical protein
MIIRRLDGLLTIVLAFVIVACCVTFICVKKVNYSAQDSSLILRTSGGLDAAAPPDGFLATGVSLHSSTNKHNGWVVRYAAKECKYCRLDGPVWAQLKDDLQRRGYQIFVVVPSARDEFPSDSKDVAEAQEETYVNVKWIKLYRLSVTPTLLIFNGKHGLIWSHQGMLDSHDPGSAMRAIEMNSQ